EAILNDLEMGKGPVRSPGWYFFTVFGNPSASGRWGWRVEGHHLSLNFTIEEGKVIASTPAFYRANPARVKDGERKGVRTLGDAEERAIDLVTSLDPDERAAAFQKEQFKETPESSTKPSVGDPQGLPAVKMTDAQRARLLKVLEAYADRMPGDIAEEEM